MNYDGSYHKLFSYPAMIEDLIKNFVAEDWVAQLDFSTLERVNAKFHTDIGDRREGDIIYKIRTFSGITTYLYIMIEFQSSPNHWMAVRMLTYVGLLWQHLIKENQISANQKLPPVFPLVLYNGERQWKSSQQLKPLMDLPKSSSLWAYQPNMRYYLIDESEHFSGKDNSITATLFTLENATNFDDIYHHLSKLIALIQQPKLKELNRDILHWLRHVFESQRQLSLPFSQVEDLLEAKDMLRERIQQMEQDLINKGLAKGFEQGIEKGIEQGIEQGIETGIQKGGQLLLIKLAERRFGTLPLEYLEKIEQATNEQLEQWGIKILDAKNVDDVFH